jgi:hypothetical protein
MRRPPTPVCVFALALALSACSGDEPAATGPTMRGGTGTPSPTIATGPTGTATIGTTRTTAPPPGSDVRLPAGMSGVVDDPADVSAIAAGDLSSLIPPGSVPASSATLASPDAPFDRIAVTWRAGGPPPGRGGLIMWQHAPGDPAWRAVYAFTDPGTKGVFGVRMEQGDVTDDGVADLLTFEDVGGSGGCGTYRVVASARGAASEILRRDVCDAEIQIAGGDLRLREAVFEPDDPHCCPSAVRTTLLHWNGSDWEEVSSEVSTVPGTG